MTTGENFAKSKLRSYFERVERLNEELTALNQDKAEVFAEAKAQGFDPKIMKIVLSRRQMERADVVERDDMIRLYEDALLGGGKKAGTKSATRARAREDDDEEAA